MRNNFITTLTNLLTTDSDDSHKIGFVTLIIFIVILVLIIISQQSLVFTVMPWDIMITLDGAWRVINGQIPHVDFSSLIPPFTLFSTALAMKMFSPSALSISYGNILLFGILTPWAWWIARSRLDAANSFLFAVFMGFLLIAPKSLWDLTDAISYAMLYNRQGYVLLSMLLLELLIPPCSSSSSQKLRSGVCSGLLLTLLLWSKLSFFAFGIAAVFIHCFFFRPSKVWWITVGLSSLSLLFIGNIFLSINVLAYIADMRIVAPVYGKHRVSGSVIKVLFYNITYLLMAFLPLLSLISIRIFSKNTYEKRGQNLFYLSTTIIFVVVASILLCSGAAQRSDIPLLWIAGLIGMEYFRRNLHLLNNGWKIAYLLNTLLITILLCGSILMQDMRSFYWSWKWSSVNMASFPASQRFQSKTLYNLVIPASPQIRSRIARRDRTHTYPQEINDGLMLLRKHISLDSRIFSMTFSNPFPFALELPPPEGGVINWTFLGTFDKESFPSPLQAFQGANMVIVPKYSDNNSDTNEAMKLIYNQYLTHHFIEKDSSKFWTLWVKV